MKTSRILILGGGFAGLWSAVGAARRLGELGVDPKAVEVILVNRDPYHSIRVRNYEEDLKGIRVPLDEVLGPVGVKRIEGEVSEIHPLDQRVSVVSESGQEFISYDRLIFALGSQLVRPDIPGLTQYAFDVDTYTGAARLDAHLRMLPTQLAHPGQFTVLIVGAGLTGTEVATLMPLRLRSVLAQAGLTKTPRTILVDSNLRIGSNMGGSAQPVIEEALTALDIEIMTDVKISSVSASGVTLSSGEVIPAATVIWCTGMRANPLTECFPVERDHCGRLPVDEYLRVKMVPNVFAAGDVAWALMDAQHPSVMSCQHARPMGRFAGYNVVNDLFGLEMIPLQIPWYVTVLDLGPRGAVYTTGWDRHVVAQGESAKRVKETINRHRIYPPLTGDRQEIMAAAAPIIQPPPIMNS